MNTDLNTVVNQTMVKTTGASATTIASIMVYPDTVQIIKATIAGRRTGGSGGSANDSAAYTIQCVFKDVSGVATQVGATDKYRYEDNANWDATVTTSGPLVLIQVTGDTSNNITWACETEVSKAQF